MKGGGALSPPSKLIDTFAIFGILYNLLPEAAFSLPYYLSKGPSGYLNIFTEA